MDVSPIQQAAMSRPYRQCLTRWRAGPGWALAAAWPTACSPTRRRAREAQLPRGARGFPCHGAVSPRATPSERDGTLASVPTRRRPTRSCTSPPLDVPALPIRRAGTRWCGCTATRLRRDVEAISRTRCRGSSSARVREAAGPVVGQRLADTGRRPPASTTWGERLTESAVSYARRGGPARKRVATRRGCSPSATPSSAARGRAAERIARLESVAGAVLDPRFRGPARGAGAKKKRCLTPPHTGAMRSSCAWPASLPRFGSATGWTSSCLGI